MEFLAVGARILLWAVVLVLLLFFAATLQLGALGLLCLHARGLCSSWDELLLELTPYADSVYVESVSSPVIAWR
jgi:hypothetical protein